MLPESGFCHGRDIPSVADCVVYNLVTSPFPGLRKIGMDLSALPRVLSTVQAVEDHLNPPIVFRYFNLAGRGEPSRMCLRIGGYDFTDSLSG